MWRLQTVFYSYYVYIHVEWRETCTFWGGGLGPRESTRPFLFPRDPDRVVTNKSIYPYRLPIFMAQYINSVRGMYWIQDVSVDACAAVYVSSRGFADIELFRSITSIIYSPSRDHFEEWRMSPAGKPQRFIIPYTWFSRLDRKKTAEKKNTARQKVSERRTVEREKSGTKGELRQQRRERDCKWRVIADDWRKWRRCRRETQLWNQYPRFQFRSLSVALSPGLVFGHFAAGELTIFAAGHISFFIDATHKEVLILLF